MFTSRLRSCVVLWAALAVAASLSLLQGASLLKFAVIIGASTALVTELMGSRVTRTHVSFPRRPVPGLPIVTLWRTRVPADEVKHLTGMAAQLGFERVKLSTKDMHNETLAFGTRAQKVAFFSAISELVPNLSIYRDKNAG